MSDFDKEAEREKLREKYERDEADREATQRMSDLLLKGATMTNTHCDVCGDPLFRYQGTTFCPSCHGGPEGVEASVGAGDEASGGTSTETETGATPSNAGQPAQDARVDDNLSEPSDGRTGTANDPERAASGAEYDDANPDRPEASPETRVPSSTAGDESRSGTPRTGTDVSGTSRAPSFTPSTGTGTRSGVDVDGDLEAGTDALVTALERFSRAAAEADDPRYAKACLEAAHEAAETLATLRE